MRWLAATAAAALAAIWPALALACPVCAQRQGGGPLGTVALGAIIVSPWIAAGTVGWWIRSENNKHETE